MTKLMNVLGGAALSVALALPTFAQDTTLRISTWLPPTHGINTEIFGGLI